MHSIDCKQGKHGVGSMTAEDRKCASVCVSRDGCVWECISLKEGAGVYACLGSAWGWVDS